MDKELLRNLPSVDELLNTRPLVEAARSCSRAIVTEQAREVLGRLRAEMTGGLRASAGIDEITSLVVDNVKRLLAPALKRVVNASGTVLHTNIGRAVLSESARAAAAQAAGNCNLEFDLDRGERGDRDSLVEDLLVRLTGAEAACVVNNNAAAVLITLNTLAEGREVVISRGELIEIGGSFRLPEIIKKSGCMLKEVGTTNRTHPNDYTEAIVADTALIFKAHTSNYRVVGFTSEVDFRELVAIGRNAGVPVVEDLGSGSLVDLSVFGLLGEPVVRDVVAAGAEAVTFSGDKLLGGPQAGLVVGRAEIIDRIRKNPLKRALRADKVTLAALEATLRLYLNPATLAQTLPTFRYLTRPVKEVDECAVAAAALLSDALGEGFSVSVEDGESVVGAGAMPGHKIPTRAVRVGHAEIKADEIFKRFLCSDPPVLGRVHKDAFFLDMRTIDEPASVVPNGF